MAEGRDASRLGSYTSTVRELIAIAAGIGAIGYAAGFMVVSSHLMYWGIADLNLVKARYISVGFMFIIHVSLILLPASLSMGYIVQKISNAPKRRKDVTSHDKESRKGYLETSIALLGRIPRAAYAAFAFTLLAFIVAALLSLVLLYVTFWNRWLGGPSGPYFDFLSNKAGPLALHWFLPLFGAGFLAPLIALNVTRNHRLLGLPNRAWLVPAILLFMLLGVRFYSNELYGNTASAVGGGSVFLVKLLPAEGKEKAVGQLMLGEPTDSPRWTWLFDQSDKSYFVLILPRDCGEKKVLEIDLDDCRAVEIAKSLIDGVVHHNKGVDGDAYCQ